MSRSTRNNTQKAFTLLDLTIALLILSIVGVLMAPQFHSLITTVRLNEATGEMVSGLQYARNLAVKYQRPFGLMADVDGNWFRVFDYQYKNDPNPHHESVPPVDAYGKVLNPANKHWYQKNFATTKIYQGVHISSVPAGGEIIFYPDGHSSYSDSIFALNYGENQKTITVNRITGGISVE